MRRESASMVEILRPGPPPRSAGSPMLTLGRTQSSELIPRAGSAHVAGVDVVRFATTGTGLATTDGGVRISRSCASGFATVGGSSELRVLACQSYRPFLAEPVTACSPTKVGEKRPTAEAAASMAAELRELRQTIDVLRHRLDHQQGEIDRLTRGRSDVEEICDRVRSSLEPSIAHANEVQKRLQQDVIQAVMKELLHSVRENRAPAGMRRERPSSDLASVGALMEKSCMEKVESRLAAMERELLTRMGAARQEAAPGRAGAAPEAQNSQHGPPPPSAQPQLDRARAAATPEPGKQESKRRRPSPIGAKILSRPEGVIFLDVDGVLHSLYGEDVFRETCCNLLERIVKKTGAMIVLSSTWRRDPAKVNMINAMFARRFMAPVHDCTREVADGKREAEICEWLDRHPSVGTWIAIDDMDLLSSDSEHARRLRGHVVHTNADTGLTLQDAERALALLQGGGKSGMASLKASSVSAPSAIAPSVTISSATTAATSRAPVSAVSTPLASTPVATSRMASPIRSSSLAASPPTPFFPMAAPTPPTFSPSASPAAWRVASPARTPGQNAYARQLRSGTASPPASSRHLLCSPSRASAMSSRSPKPGSMSIPISGPPLGPPSAAKMPASPPPGHAVIVVQ